MRQKPIPSETKKKILDASIELFSVKGYDRTSMRDIAKEIGIKSSSIYNHYDSKKAILEEIVGIYHYGVVDFIDYEKVNQYLAEDRSPMDILSCLTLRQNLEQREFLLKCFRVMQQASYINPKVIYYNEIFEMNDYYRYTITKLIERGDVLPKVDFFVDLLYRVSTMYIVESNYPKEVIEKKKTPIFSETIDQLFYSFLTEEGRKRADA